MSDYSELEQLITKALTKMPLAAEYADEQRDLQPDIKRAVDAALSARYGGKYKSVSSTGGEKPKPSIKMLGTSYWPDLEIREANEAIVGMEVKLIRKEHSPAKPLAEAFGQALIYRLRYPLVYVMIVHYGNYNPNLNKSDESWVKLLKGLNISLIVRHS